MSAVSAEATGRLASIYFEQLRPGFFPTEAISPFWGKNLVLQCPLGHPAIHLIQAASGLGKSSLIAFLTGLRRDYTGQIVFGGLFNNRALATLNEAEWSLLRRCHLSTVYQDFRLIPWLNPLANLALRPAETRQSTSKGLLGSWADTLELDLHRPHPVVNLSRGEQQRLAIIRALDQPFELLLLDEPFSHLDRRLRRRAAELIRQHCQTMGASILLLDLETSDDFPLTSQLSLTGAAS